MAMLTELHAQAAVWTLDGRRLAVLLLECEAPDRATGGMVSGALLAAVRARGLRLITDPDQLPLWPIPGWRIHLDDADALTLNWPHSTPLLAAAQVRLPDGWRSAANDLGAVIVFAGRGLGLHERRADGLAHATQNLRTAAENGLAAGGTVRLASMPVRMYAERQGRPLEHVEVALRHSRIYAQDCADCETKSGRVDRIERDIRVIGNLDAAQRRKLLEIAEKCPVHRTLRSETSIQTTALPA